ncbi:TetR/AcrR family transcriptional regulator [Oceanobacillus jeddahense]|uniref:TetR/AcrR family transcriptional regulator n=1 Tax=Oceanobacillus jeddahense TaxID=1462527 RepID=A0ABY5JVW2_9BACI|nr:TetR/AcrR family transcriptional regulator [Oceanobacillus jeddahense]UUI04476.1 TetR/AcrR family transcriptional regulator [Oceanobacillus jeddahense]
MDKKEEIMQSAIHLFSKKGYSATSVQEIANDCRISKGTLYNFFDSKEELLIQVIRHNHRKMLEQAENLNLESSLPPKEKLIQKIVIQFDGIRENKDYLSMLLTASPPHDNPKISLLMKRIRITMTNWYKDCFMEAYGSQVEPYIWDLALMFQGTLKEYTSMIFRDHKELDFEKVARFVVERFDTMIQHTRDAEPVLPPWQMEEYEAFKPNLEPKTPEQQMEELLEELLEKVKKLTLHDEAKEEYILAVQALQKEIHEKKPKTFMIKSLLLFLAEIKECEPLVRRMERFLKTLQTT